MKKYKYMSAKNSIIIASILVIVLMGIYFLNTNNRQNSLESFSAGSLTLSENNLLSVTGSCRPDGDSEWCCDDPGYVICGNTDVCGPSRTWCDNYLSGDKSCNYVVGGNRCCNTAGAIYDYSSNRCCTKEMPFHYSNGDQCYFIQSPTSDNYYTRLSSCDALKSPNGECATAHDGAYYFGSCDGILENKCVGNNFYQCGSVGSSGDDRFIFDFQNKGQIIDRCGVECISGQEKCEGNNLFTCENNKFVNKGTLLNKCGVNCISSSDCNPERTKYLFSSVPLSQSICKGNSLYRIDQINVCSNNQCGTSPQEVLVETCSYACTSNETDSYCVDKICNSDEVTCSMDSKSTEICVNNELVTKEICKYDCKKGSCINFNFKLLYTFIVVFLIVIVYIILRRIYGKKR